MNLISNAASVQSNLGDSALGLLHLTIYPTFYTTLLSIPFFVPVNLDSEPIIPDYSTVPAIADLRYAFQLVNDILSSMIRRIKQSMRLSLPLSKNYMFGPFRVSNQIDALGDFISLNNNVYVDHNLFEALFHFQKGRSNFRDYLWHLQHKAAPLIERCAKHGVHVLIHSSPWTLERNDQAI